ncbi:hypothetical protein SAY87_017613 [Trapa incisa]|uniref:Phytocyanin domain-containing protein n=1 Tax=Trapa incisa TaxID=236973 RepID=A0AAN7LA81_9MYRT|nr:hypothetical protein SAY87_017613 [Trapa incisa]
MEGKVEAAIGMLVLVVMAGLLYSSEAYVFTVGGKDGWSPKPSEGYNQWAGRNRFQVNDSLLFKYQKGADSVLVVRRDNYASCNTEEPIASLTDGDSLFVLNRSGPFFFISGKVENCYSGQKMIVIVLAERDITPAPQPLPPHTPGAATPPTNAQNGFPAPVPTPPVSSAPSRCSSSVTAVLWFSVMVTYLVLG